MNQPCPKTNCTHGATGVCFLNFDPSAQCPVLLGQQPPDWDGGSAEPDTGQPNEVAVTVVDGEEEAGRRIDAAAAMLDAPSRMENLKPPNPSKVRLPPGRELGLDGLARVAAKRPVRLIGLLGAPDAGKTMALISMFLLAARGRLTGFEYRNSESVFALDELSKGARAWSADGGILDQVVPHTELANERRPGFLHVRLQASSIDAAIDLAFPDLPGEWTDTLVNRDAYERLSFLANADVIWIFVDGQALADMNFGHDICDRTLSLIGRLATNLPRRVPIKLVVTRADQYEQLPPAMLDPILERAVDKGFDIEVHEIISVDKAEEARSGQGIAALLDASVAVATFENGAEDPPLPSSRRMLRYVSETAR